MEFVNFVLFFTEQNAQFSGQQQPHQQQINTSPSRGTYFPGRVRRAKRRAFNRYN